VETLQGKERTAGDDDAYKKGLGAFLDLDVSVGEKKEESGNLFSKVQGEKGAGGVRNQRKGPGSVQKGKFEFLGGGKLQEGKSAVARLTTQRGESRTSGGVGGNGA